MRFINGEEIEISIEQGEAVIKAVKSVTSGYANQSMDRLSNELAMDIVTKLIGLGYSISDETRLVISKACDSVSKKVVKAS
jgi:hypothetical protein